MQCTRKISDAIYWVGGSDRRLQLFENLFPIEKGISYNSYIIMDEKITLVDTVDASIREQYLENIKYIVDDKEIDYLVIHHMEPDHCATLEELVHQYPNMKIVTNQKVITMIHQFYEDLNIENKTITIKEGDTLSLGKHELHFIMAPMVHWPEVMMSYESKEKILFSADAFGTFGAFNGHIFNDEIHFDRDWLEDARRYYTNIVGKFGMQVQAVLKKAANLDIQMICSLHGPIWRTNIEYIIHKYDIWSRYEPEENGVLIVYGSIYGHTENVANVVSCRLADKGVKNIAVYDVSKTDISVLVAESFRYSHIILACSTYNMGIFPKMEAYINDIKALALQNRTVAIIENGSWAKMSGKLIKEKIEAMKDMTLLDTTISITSSIKKNQTEEIDQFVEAVVTTII